MPLAFALDGSADARAGDNLSCSCFVSQKVVSVDDSKKEPIAAALRAGGCSLRLVCSVFAWSHFFCWIVADHWFRVAGNADETLQLIGPCTGLNLTGRGITANDCSTLRLVLEVCLLDDASPFVEALLTSFALHQHANCKITSLNLSSNNIGADGARWLAGAVQVPCVVPC